MLYYSFPLIVALSGPFFVSASPAALLSARQDQVGTATDTSGLTVQTEVASAPGGTAGISAYTPGCSPDNTLDWNDVWFCWKYLHNKGDTPCVANPGAQFCQQGTVKISGLGLYQGTSQTTCSDVANTMETIWSTCRTDSLGQPALTGGSAATSQNPNLIVHMQPYWVVPGKHL